MYGTDLARNLKQVFNHSLNSVFKCQAGKHQQQLKDETVTIYDPHQNQIKSKWKSNKSLAFQRQIIGARLQNIDDLFVMLSMFHTALQDMEMYWIDVVKLVSDYLNI